MEIAILPTFNYDIWQKMDIFTNFYINDYNKNTDSYKQSFGRELIYAMQMCWVPNM